jgi:hypothetical protein
MRYQFILNSFGLTVDSAAVKPKNVHKLLLMYCLILP